MKERLLLDGIDMPRDHAVVRERIQGPAPVDPNTAGALRAVENPAIVRTQNTTHPVIPVALPVERLVD